MITGKTTLIAHLGFPTTTFKAPMYNRTSRTRSTPRRWA